MATLPRCLLLPLPLPLAVAVAVAWLLGVSRVAATVNQTCFELPVVILSPVSEPFPTKTCVTPAPPAIDCMKRNVDVNIEVIDHNDAARAHNFTWNCIEGPRTGVHRSTAHFRGQSSLRFKKNQLSVHLKAPAALVDGFPADRAYVLHGPWIDGSLIRNHLAHWLFRATGRYSPRSRHVVMFIRDPDGQLQYHGVYLLLEKITYDSVDRVGLAPLTPACQTDEQLSGGWAWQLNPLNFGVYSPNMVNDQYEVMFGAGERPVLMFPRPNALTPRMRDFFVNTTTGPMPRLFRYLFEGMKRPDELEQHIDLGSFVDYMLHSELSQNTDAYRRSTYFFKDRGQPINAGPVWDFNLAFGLGANKADWLFRPYSMWRRLTCNYKFVALIAKRWRELRASVWSDTALEQFIEQSAAPLRRQFARCVGTKRKGWASNALQCANVKPKVLFNEQIEKVRQAVTQRAHWMDANVAKLYMKIDPAPWNPATDLPQYNCAADGNDAGCLEDPERYINAAEIVMPPIRQPTPQNTTCGVVDAKTLDERDTPSIDPCWLSAGTYITDGSITPFCSGNGFCPPGPGAKCTCIRGKQPPTCGSLNIDVNDMDEGDGDVEEMTLQSDVAMQRWGSATYLALLTGGVLLLLLLVAGQRARNRRRRHHQSMLAEHDELRRAHPTTYGATD
ncbi:hypothetical protein P43SY_006578 [Pythium insidiosum]|uniref:Spore coat protein CotH n=1 Tax=Pythium insidiosum TaxID=114742 RepID=A0AAD5LYL8_PYTIN|nr:hypothetical protein P43SY_006578 [Pythium insidiosum]